jgi:hypothetical protein
MKEKRITETKLKKLKKQGKFYKTNKERSVDATHSSLIFISTHIRDGFYACGPA